MKKILIPLLCALLIPALAGCGGSKTEAPAPTAIPAATQAPAAETKAPEPTAAPEVTAEPAPAEPDTSELEAKIAAVKALIGRPVEELYDAIGDDIVSPDRFFDELGGSRVLTMFSLMEIKGFVKSLPGGMYRKIK